MPQTPQTGQMCQSTGCYRSGCRCSNIIRCYTRKLFPACPECGRAVRWTAVPLVRWVGQSGRLCYYLSFPFGYDPAADAVGNYIFAKWSPKQNRCLAVKVGEGQFAGSP